jgi:hypothetical protein
LVRGILGEHRIERLDELALAVALVDEEAVVGQVAPDAAACRRFFTRLSGLEL